MLVHPPREGFFRRKFWNLEGITRLAVRRETNLVRILVIDADSHDVETHDRTQLACQNTEEFLGRTSRDEGLGNTQECFVPFRYWRFGRFLNLSAHRCTQRAEAAIQV